MKDHKHSLNRKCTCSQLECPIRGNCVLCVQNHIENNKHLPECMQNLIRENIKRLSQMVEYKNIEDRPDKDFWKTFDKKELLEKSIERHSTKNKEK